jgi:hypothetical protein
MRNPFRYFNSSPEVIRLVVMMYIRYPLSLRQVEDLLFERGLDICHETVRFWWNRFGPMFAKEIRKRRIQTRSYSQWRWHLDEVFTPDSCSRRTPIICSSVNLDRLIVRPLSGGGLYSNLEEVSGLRSIVTRTAI